MRKFFSKRLWFINSLKLHFSESGYTSETYDFTYICVADDRIIHGGRGAYWLLSPFALTKEYVAYPYGYGGLKQMDEALSALR